MARVAALLALSRTADGMANIDESQSVADAGSYLWTSMTEGSQAAMRKRIAEEGIAYWFEHTGEADSDTRGTHTLVLSRHAERDRGQRRRLGTVRPRSPDQGAVAIPARRRRQQRVDTSTSGLTLIAVALRWT
ncbi:hypothetical protein ABFO19_11870 [Xanthomonas citri pv. glycines]|uniref:Uncharacterized protein n=2 Tax=Xanthomonas cissicola TaxID=86186 RepID=A0ABX3M020_9XANT|nr:hypothetical protein [Xanthomonas cissicola]KAB0529644.1 hypothetical protein F7R02_21990 [Xanthomonas cissicola]OOW65530.1 hypothetical protein Xant_22010 [Xanthomonas cissicola]